jgi:hypothetical protein
MRVELDAFSGRPNPVWDLTDEQADEFHLRLSTLPPSDPKTPIWSGLGYRGLVVRSSEDVGDFDEVRLFDEAVIVRKGHRLETFIDTGRRLEQTLFETARGHFDDSTFEFVQRQLTT